ncbi:rhodanese-like domain-containing protein [Nereida ignava]|nr:rhodanese-like domain-containing protein [Nereida ignava]
MKTVFKVAHFMHFKELIACCVLMVGPAQANDVGITKGLMNVTVQTADGVVDITRNQDPNARLQEPWTQTSRPCPNFCIQPMIPAPGVAPVGELEVLEFLQREDAVLVDGRLRTDYDKATIPGAISIPYTQAADRLDELGCEIDFDGWICSDAAPIVVLFCNGPWCGQSPTAARRMIAAGYPAEKIRYYRGGMQSWNMLGLTVHPGNG